MYLECAEKKFGIVKWPPQEQEMLPSSIYQQCVTFKTEFSRWLLEVSKDV